MPESNWDKVILWAFIYQWPMTQEYSPSWHLHTPEFVFCLFVLQRCWWTTNAQIATSVAHVLTSLTMSASTSVTWTSSGLRHHRKLPFCPPDEAIIEKQFCPSQVLLKSTLYPFKILSIKEGSIMYHLKRLWYDSTGVWTTDLPDPEHQSRCSNMPLRVKYNANLWTLFCPSWVVVHF